MKPYKIAIDNESLNVHTLMDEAFKAITNKLTRQMDEICIEGLKRKGFDLDINKINEVESFIKSRCRCEDNLHSNEKVYFVDDEPFLIHYYGIKNNFDINQSENTTTCIANFGKYSFL